eukprot:PhM_4_TR4920/c0_g1_i1/m.49420
MVWLWTFFELFFFLWRGCVQIFKKTTLKRKNMSLLLLAVLLLATSLPTTGAATGGTATTAAGSRLLVLLILFLLVLLVVVIVVGAGVSLASEVLDGAHDDALTDRLAELEVLLDAVRQIVLLVVLAVFLALLRTGLRGLKEVEEALTGLDARDVAHLLGLLRALLLLLLLNGEVLARLPLDVEASGLGQHHLAVVVLELIRLRQHGTLEELILLEDKRQRETLSRVLHESALNIDKVLEAGLVALGDKLTDAAVILEGTEPEPGDALGIGALALREAHVLLVLLGETALHFLVGGLGDAAHNVAAVLKQRAVLSLVLLVERGELLKVLSVAVVVLLLESLEAADAATDLGRQGGDKLGGVVGVCEASHGLGGEAFLEFLVLFLLLNVFVGTGSGLLGHV